MNQVSLALTAVLMLAMALMMLPSVIAMNRGKMLRNIAAWLAIFALLGLAYKTFGPGREAQPPGGQPVIDQNSTPPSD